MKLQDISDTENQLVKDAPNEYGEYYAHAQFAIDLFHTAIKDSSYEAVFFSMFLATAEKHIVIAALSGIRHHHVQANLDLRYAVESGCWAAYALAHPDPALYAEMKDDETMEPTKALKGKMYQWLEEKYPAGSESLKRFKEGTNKLSTHANIVDAHRNFNEMKRHNISTSFFDTSEEHHIKTDLWAVANLSMGLLDIFYGVNKDFPRFAWRNDFLSHMRILKNENARLKAEMMEHPRLKPHAERAKKDAEDWKKRQ